MSFSRWLRFLSRPIRPLRNSRPRLESLEDRTLPAMITWIGTSSGNFDVAANWMGGKVPGSGDDAVINTTGTQTITIQSGDSLSLNSLTTAANDTLSITGGSLSVAAASTLAGPLTMTGGMLTASGASATLTASGATSVSAANLFAGNGGTLSLPGLTTFTSNGSTFQAKGTNSVLNVSNLSTLMQAGGMTFTASNGGEINLSSLTSLTSTKGISINDTAGGILLDGSLASLSGVTATLDGTDTQVANSWMSFTGGSLTVSGGSYNLTKLTDVDQSSLFVSNGGQLALPNLISYVSNGTFSAKNANSVLNFSALTTVTQFNGWTISATNSGQVNLSGMTSLTSTKGITIIDNTAGSLLDSNLTTLNGVTALLDGTDTQVMAAWTKFLGGSLTVSGGSYSLAGLTDVDQSSLNVSNGGQLALPGLTSYVVGGTFSAKNAGSLLDVSALTTVIPSNIWGINITASGEVNLGGLANLTSSKGVTITDNTGTLLAGNLATMNGVTLDVTSSTLSLPSLSTATGSSLTADSGSTLTVPANVSGGTLTVKTTGTLIAGSDSIGISSLAIPAAVSTSNWSGTFTGTATDTTGKGLASVGVSFFNGSDYFDGKAFESATPVYNLANLSGTLWTYAIPIIDFPIDVSCSVTVQATDKVGGMETAAVTSLALAQSPPVVTAITPFRGLVNGGTTVTITGLYLSQLTAVDFGASNPATIISQTTTSIVVTTPSGTLGTPDITLTTPQGTSAKSSADRFTYLAAPTSTVNPLPTFSPANFQVSWSGLADKNVDIAYYDIYISDNGGAFTLWLHDTPQTSAIFAGQDGHQYGFYSVATDTAGDVQTMPTSAQASTVEDAAPPTSSVNPLPAFTDTATFTVSWSGSDGNGSGIAGYNVYVSDNGGTYTPLFSSITAATLTQFMGVTGHTYRFYTIATDNVGNVQPVAAGGSASAGDPVTVGPVTAALTITPASVPVPTGTVTNTVTVDTQTAFTAPLAPLSQSTTDVPSTDVTVYTAANNRTYAYVADLDDITIIDVTDPTTPQLMGTFGTSDLVRGGFNFDQIGDGHYLFVGSRILMNASSLNLLVYDLSNPLAPSLVSTTSIAYPYLYGMVVEGNTVYFPVSSISYGSSSGVISSQNGDFLAVDITNPNKPALAGVLSSGMFTGEAPPLGGKFNVNGATAVTNQIAYAASTTSTGASTTTGVGQLLVVNTADPTNLSVVNTLNIPGTIQLIGVSADPGSNRALVVGSTGGWLNPFTVGATYGISGNITLTVLDTTNPQDPVILGTTKITANQTSTRATVSKLVVSDLGNGVFAVSNTITSGDDPTTLVVDINDPNNIIVENVPATSLTSGMTVSNGDLYVADAGGLAVYQIGSIGPTVGAAATVSVDVPTNTGVTVNTSSFNVAPDQTTTNGNITTYTWSRNLGFGNTELTFSWQSSVTGLAVGASISTTLDGSVQYTYQGNSVTVNLPGTMATGLAVSQTIVDTPTVSVAMKTPANGSSINNNEPALSATVTANPSNAVANVQLQYSSDGGTTWNNAGPAVTSAPYMSTIPTALADGSYEARAVATDTAGQTTTSAAITFSIDTIPPTVSMTAPANGSFTNNIPTLTATASDNTGGSGLASVQLQYSSNGGLTWNNAGTARTVAPFGFTFTTALPGGPYQARAVATDKAGNITTSSAVSFTVDTTTVSVTMNMPINGSITNNNRPALGATATANPSSALANVQLQYSSDGGTTWNNAGPAKTSAPFTYTFPTALPDGSYEARAVATDNLGNTTTSAVVSFLVDTTGPTVSMTAPVNGSNLTIKLPMLSASASDTSGGSGLASVQFQYSNNAGKTWSNIGPPETSAPFSFTFTTALPDGHYQARATAIDKANNSTTSSAVSFTIDTTPPSVAMTAPISGSTTPNSKPTLSANASDGGSGLASVQFEYSSDNGTTWNMLGSPETTGPFSYTFSTALANGTYKARAIAVDNAGNTTTSAVDTFTIKFVPATPTLSITTGGTVALGSGNALTASATLANGSTPGGTITFTLYGTNGTTVLNTEMVNVNNNGTYKTPNGILPTTAGTYEWQASYSGDPYNKAATSIKAAEVVSTGSPTVTTTPGGTVVLGTGTKLTCSATLANGYNPTGTITFVLDAPSGAAVDTEKFTVSGNAVYSTTNGYLPTTAGTYHWVVSYSGDGNNKAASSPATNGPEVAVGPGATVAGTTLYLVGGSGDDSIQIRPSGKSTTGSTGVVVNANLNGAAVATTYTQAFTGIDVVGFGGNDSMQMASSLTIPAVVSEGDGNDYVQLAGGNDSVLLGNGNDFIQVGGGNNVVVTGNGADNIQAGNGNNLIAAGLGQHTVVAGNGSNILIDGSVQLTQSGDSLAAVLNDWTQMGSVSTNVAGIRSRLNVTYNSSDANILLAGSGLDWFWETYGMDTTNKKATDLLN